MSLGKEARHDEGQAQNSSTTEAETGDCPKFKASTGYRKKTIRTNKQVNNPVS